MGRKLRLFVTVVLLGMVTAASCNACPNQNNFGKDCAYECHCSSNEPCNEDGSCPNGCATGWSGEYCQRGNAALGKNASQSSTIADFRASRAIDGRTDQARPHCTYTYYSTEPWWMVDLGREYVLLGLRIFTCSSCGGPGSFKIWMRDTPNTDSSSGNLCYHYAPGYVSSGASPTITCTSPAVGRYLIIKRMESDNLVLCEVITDAFQFRACDNKRYGLNCNIQCQCANNVSCDVSTGACPSGCNENYTGPSCNLPSGKGLPTVSKTESTSNSIAVQWPYIIPRDGGYDTWYVSRYELKYYQEKSTNSTKEFWFPPATGLIIQNVTGLEPSTNYSFLIGVVYLSTKGGEVIESAAGPVKSFKTLAVIWPGGCPNQNNFGKDCAYECHCSGNEPCYKDGSCPNGCATGWSGEYCQRGNAALGKNASQSSTVGHFRAYRAVNGGLSQVLLHCTYTYNSKEPWWRVDLGKDYVLLGLRILICSSCGTPGSLKIWMRNTLSTDSSSGNLCYHYDPGYISSGASPTITCNPSTVGRYLIIKLMATDNLSLCEVIIDAFQFRECDNKRYGPNCNIQCQCANNVSCDVSTGACPSGCNDNYTGPSCNLPKGQGLPTLSKTESTSNSIAVQWPHIRTHNSGYDTWSLSKYELTYYQQNSTRNSRMIVSLPSITGLINYNVTYLKPLTNYNFQIGAVYRSAKTGQVINNSGQVTTLKTLGAF